jgi:hypothetical protein
MHSLPKTFGAIGAAIVCCSCSATYKNAPSAGKFEGEPRMVAIAPNTFFFYQPRNEDHFSYTTAPLDINAPNTRRGRGKYRLANLKITPEPMLTTGASIPRSLWLIPGFSNFDFTRAAIIHDWLYEAHYRWEIAKESGNEAQMNRYEAYKDITQADAADIFAECIKSTMISSDNLRADLVYLQKDAPQGIISRLEDLRNQSKNTRSKRWKLHAYHYFVSPDCLLRKSVKMWNAKHDDLGLYEILGGKHAKVAVDRGYLSPWLVESFRNVYQFKHDQLIHLQQIKVADAEAEKAGKLRARIYLVVSDGASEAAIRSRGANFSEGGFDLKTAAVGSTVRPNELKVVYYREADAAQAQSLLNLIEGMLPEGANPNPVAIKLIPNQNWARPKHYDVHIGSELAQALSKNL